ncbi:TPM domain-containing protein [Lacinutrix jangbogonensis]|uniref:TPM domain-containing protein n=1 Tax=Lacinutrix jangbogonensis TaxID=1469557 RepID=UPI0006893235|nr:TPM domain-containing protein [Lacinutrix jangbogonensis]
MKDLILIFSVLVLISCKKETSSTLIYNKVVQDYSDLFSEAEEQKLSEKIINYEKRSTNQICVYTIDSIPNNEAIQNHAKNLANNLGVGTKEKNNGLLILISRLDRKIAIATGTGTQRIITDSFAKTIIENTILPQFKNSHYFEGISIGLDSIIVKWH